MHRPLWQNLVGWGGVVAMLAVAVFVFLTYQPGSASTPVPASNPAPPVQTTLHDAGAGVTCWVMSRGEEILGQGCLR